MDFTELKFLLKLTEYKNYRASLTKGGVSSFKGKNEACESLGKDGLVEIFTQEIETKDIDTVEITSTGKSLLSNLNPKQKEVEGILDVNALKILRKFVNKNTIKAADIKITGLKAPDRNIILQRLETQTFIKFVYKRKRTGAEVWLTEKGIEHLSSLNKHSQALRQRLEPLPPIISPPLIIEPKLTQKPTDAEVLQIIQDLDREYKTNNYLPIFYLRDKLEPPLSREELDQMIYRLEDSGQLELSTLVHTENYTLEQRSAGISQPAGGPIFYIILTSQ